jgi:hypothetical protein
MEVPKEENKIILDLPNRSLIGPKNRLKNPNAAIYDVTESAAALMLTLRSFPIDTKSGAEA